MSNQYLLDLSRLNWQIFRKDVQASSKRCLPTCACEMSSVIIKEGLFMQRQAKDRLGSFTTHRSRLTLFNPKRISKRTREGFANEEHDQQRIDGSNNVDLYPGT